MKMAGTQRRILYVFDALQVKHQNLKVRLSYFVELLSHFHLEFLVKLSEGSLHHFSEFCFLFSSMSEKKCP